jgi:hypothetical protein
VTGRGRRLWESVAILLAAIALLPTSVLLLVVIDKSFAVDWSRLSNVGQALSVVSALLSGGALVGVVVSIRLQARQTQVMQFQSMRAMRLDLLQAAMDNEEYLAVWGYAPSASAAQLRTRAYVSSVFSYYQVSFGLGAFPEAELRLVLTRAFASEDIRTAWHDIRQSYAVEGWPPEFKRFARIVDETCQQVAAAEIPKAAEMAIPKVEEGPTAA